MRHFNLFYFLGIINIRYDTETQSFARDKVPCLLKFLLHLLLPNAVLLYVILIGKSGILLIVPSVHMIVFYARLATTVATMNYTLLLNYFYSSTAQMALLNDCLARIKRQKSVSFRGSTFALALFSVHYINYELNQYTYVVRFNEEMPEFTFYVVFYLIEMITVMTMLYYGCVLAAIKCTVELDCAELASRADGRVKFWSSSLNCDERWWREFERVDGLNNRKRQFCRAFEFQLLAVIANTFFASFTIFYVNLNSVLSIAHDHWIAVYSRVTESLGFFSQLIALFLTCYHCSGVKEQEEKLVQIIGRLQYGFWKKSTKLFPMDFVNFKSLMMHNIEPVSLFGLFSLDMNFYFGMLAAIVTYLVVLLQFREIELA
ncbi:gustatory receptor 68a-like isoform X2 [Anopheles albimanus]|uniref:Gustatory receptor n=1 Tax=Anopheles albimanus TaxID=7167 RepID=A0A182FZL0_ANOAL|nr:gustatory receptor 68a-like isoform X2 [Anopheles albimanus]